MLQVRAYLPFALSAAFTLTLASVAAPAAERVPSPRANRPAAQVPRAKGSGKEKAPSASAPRWSVQTNALSAALGSYSLSADYRFARTYTVGPEVHYMYVRFGDVKQRMWGGGIRLNLQLNGPAFGVGWYLGPSFRYLTGELSGSSDVRDVTAIVAGTVFGYQKWWSSGVNARLGAGIFYSTLTRFVELRDGSGATSRVSTPAMAEIHPGMEFSIGYSF